MEFDKDGSPYIPFPAPYQNLRLTPPRYADGVNAARIHNDPRVYMNLSGPPYPYTQESWDSWWPIVSKVASDALAEFKDVQAGKRKWVRAGSPVMVIREMKGDGDGELIGDIAIRMQEFLLVKDVAERKRARDENEGFEAGDPRIAWEMGFYLSPDAHGRGIMPVALQLLIEKFFVPYMNVHRLTGTFYDHNTASKRVFEKNGFKFMGITPDVVEIAESKTGVKGKRVGLGMMFWERKTGL